MLRKLRFILLAHFKLVFALNICLSAFFGYLFFLKGFDRVLLYNLALFFKGLAYLTTVAIEKLFFPTRVFYYKNLGLSYRRLFSLVFAVDLIIFILILTGAWLFSNYM